MGPVRSIQTIHGSLKQELYKIQGLLLQQYGVCFIVDEGNKTGQSNFIWLHQAGSAQRYLVAWDAKSFIAYANQHRHRVRLELNQWEPSRDTSDARCGWHHQASSPSLACTSLVKSATESW